MNLLLVSEEEAARGRLPAGDRRVAHLRGVVGVQVGGTVRAGVIGGGVGRARVVAVEPELVFELVIEGPGAGPWPVDLIVAVPRPKVMVRVIETAAAFGVRRVDLVNAWRVDKSYLDSPRLGAGALTEAVRKGAEQGGTTYLTEVALHRRLMGFLDGWRGGAGAGAGAGAATRLIAHPRGGVAIERAWAAASGLPAVIAIGPEGGWIEREVETFAARGFAVVELAAPVLRVEAALAVALGQVALLARARAR